MFNDIIKLIKFMFVECEWDVKLVDVVILVMDSIIVRLNVLYNLFFLFNVFYIRDRDIGINSLKLLLFNILICDLSRRND